MKAKKCHVLHLNRVILSVISTEDVCMYFLLQRTHVYACISTYGLTYSTTIRTENSTISLCTYRVTPIRSLAGKKEGG